MLSPMSEKEDKVKTSKKTSPKKTAAKSQSKTKSRSGTTAKKKPRSSNARKKRSRGNIIAALVILCALLLGLNLILVLKLVPNLKSSLKSEEMASVTAPQVSSHTPKADLQHTEHIEAQPETAKSEEPKQQPVQSEKRENTPTAQQKTSTLPQQQADSAAQQKTASSQEKAPTAKTTTPAAQSAPHSPAAASASRTASAAQKDTAKKEKSAVHAAPQKNTVPEKSVAPDKKKTASKKNSVPEKPAVPDKKKAVQKVQPAAKPEKPRKPVPYAGNLTFVFDDAGHNLDQLEHFLRLPFPCTIAVLPGLRYSSESARRIRKAGKQVILHQPMQSVDLHINPGPGAVTPGLSAEQIKNIVRKNLEEIWPVAGMNNHEGSLMTADEAAMSAVLDVVAEKHIFFLDSRTTARSVVAKVAKEKNMAVWERAIFIDNDKSRAAMETQIKKGLSIARQKGSAIMIGHVFTIELAELLTEMYPALIEEGFSLSEIAQVAQKGTVNFGN